MHLAQVGLVGVFRDPRSMLHRRPGMHIAIDAKPGKKRDRCGGFFGELVVTSQVNGHDRTNLIGVGRSGGGHDPSIAARLVQRRRFLKYPRGAHAHYRRGMDVQGKAAFITGGGTGVGRATALALAAQGCDVAVNYSRSKDAAEQTAADITALGVKGVALQGDVAEDADCRRMVDEAVAEFGRLDVLVNCAGTTVFVPHADLDGITAEDWHRLYAVNAMGPFQMMRAAAPHLKADGGGEVISISSVSGVAGVGSSLPYCASKAALNNLTVTMARVLAPEVRVNAVAPGFITGRWWKEAQGDEIHDKVAGAIERIVPLQAVCDPEDVADACMGFIQGSDLATGQVLVVDGGMLIQTPR